MNQARFEAILAAYGADPRRWPPAERAPAEAFARDHGAAVQAELGAARALDALLALEASAEAPSASLAARIVERAPRPAFGWRAPALALAACAVCGVIIGFSAGVMTAPSSAADAVLASAFATPIADAEADGDDG